MYITKLREGMESFWDDVTADEIHAVYTICTPTHSDVLRNLAVTVADQQEDRVSRWLTPLYQEQRPQVVVSIHSILYGK